MDKGSGDKKALNVDFRATTSSNNLRGEALHTALEKEETLRTMINNSHVILFLWKNEDKWPVEFVSENVVKLGYGVEDFISGKIRYKDLIYPDDLKKVEEEFKNKVKSGDSSFSMEYRIITKAGDLRWINERTFIQRNTGTEATHFQGVVLDITRRKKSEEELEKTLKMQKILTTAVNNSPAVVFLWRNEKYWPVIFVSENVIQFGYTVEDFLSQAIQYGKIIHPEDLKRVEAELERNIQKGQVRFNSEYRIFTKAGDLLWVNERTFIQREKDGRIACFQGIVLDITRRKRVERALRKSLEMQKTLKNIINRSPVVVFLGKSLDKPVEFVSENVTQFGYSVEDFLSGKILYRDIIHKEDLQAVIESLARSARERYDSFEMEYRIFTEDGNIRWVEELTSFQRDSKGEVTHFQGIVIDVTERKEAQKMLEIQRELGVSLSTTWSLQTMLNHILDACLKIEKIDAAGIYLKDELLGQINLVAHRGLSPEFVKNVSRYMADSPEARQIWTEKPVYRTDFFTDKMVDLIRKEEITAIAIIPMKHRGEIIGSLNFASHTTDKIPLNVRNFLESVALQVVSYIAPVRIVADLG